MSNHQAIMPERQLTAREREVLRLVVRSFVDTAGPVGSRFLAKRYGLGLSPASIRNTMSDLEELGYLDHPYTSAGRIPTEMGYRLFVNELMETSELTPEEKTLIKSELDRLMGDTEELLREGSRLLGRLSNLLGVALTPKLSAGVLNRLEIVPLSSTRVMFIISVRGGMVRTIVYEADWDLSRDVLDRMVAILNERLAGLTLEEIQRTFEPRLRDIDDEQTGIIRLVLNEAPVLFSEQPEGRRLRYGGAQNLILQPEFRHPQDLRDLIKMIEDEDFVVHLLENRRSADDEVGRAMVSIGSEHSESVGKYSIVTARYKMGRTFGTIGVIGPMRMNYARVVSLVENLADLLSRDAD